MLNGYKTYIVAVVSIAWAVFGLAQGMIDGVTATNVILAALGAVGIRNAIK